MGAPPPPGGSAGCTRCTACIRPGRRGGGPPPGSFGGPARVTSPAGPVRGAHTPTAFEGAGGSATPAHHRCSMRPAAVKYVRRCTLAIPPAKQCNAMQ
eukprot:gene18297-biopygen17393